MKTDNTIFLNGKLTEAQENIFNTGNQISTETKKYLEFPEAGIANHLKRRFNGKMQQLFLISDRAVDVGLTNEPSQEKPL
jgi:hypothetical protein